MYIFDFNIHLPYIKHEDVNIVIEQDMTLDVKGLIKGFDIHKKDIKSCNGANILLFNTKLFQTDISDLFKAIDQSVDKVKYTALVDFRDVDINLYIDNLVKSGVHTIMFNSYLQKIADSDFQKVIEVCKYASSKKLIICIDGSYGTSKMYTYDNLKLACTVADYIEKTPIVIVHSGGYRVMEAMLLAADKQNVWLDTSFSLPYYKNSSIELDFAYVIKKMNCERVVFGSDHPYINFDEAIEQHFKFFEKHKFNTSEIENIMGLNALKLFNEN